MAHRTRTPVLITTDEQELIECFRWLSPEASRAAILLITSSMDSVYAEPPHDIERDGKLRLVNS